MEALKFNLANQPKSPSQNNLQQTLDHNPVRSYLPKKASNMPLIASVVKSALDKASSVCPKCGSTKLVKKDSTLWEAVD